MNDSKINGAVRPSRNFMSTSGATLDLSNCDKEPIRTPGTIQPHGFLLTLSDALDVLQASENVLDLIGCSAESVIGCALDAVVGAPAAQQLAPSLSAQLGSRPSYVGTITATSG